MTIVKALEITQNGCYTHAKNLEIESKKRVCKSRSKEDKARMKELAEQYTEAADTIHPVVTCWPDMGYKA